MFEDLLLHEYGNYVELDGDRDIQGERETQRERERESPKRREE